MSTALRDPARKTFVAGAHLACRLVLDGDALGLRRFGLKRRVPLEGSIEIGPIYGSRPTAGMASYADDFNVAHETVRTGS